MGYGLLDGPSRPRPYCRVRVAPGGTWPSAGLWICQCGAGHSNQRGDVGPGPTGTRHFPGPRAPGSWPAWGSTARALRHDSGQCAAHPASMAHVRGFGRSRRACGVHGAGVPRAVCPGLDGCRPRSCGMDRGEGGGGYGAARRKHAADLRNARSGRGIWRGAGHPGPCPGNESGSSLAGSIRHAWPAFGPTPGRCNGRGAVRGVCSVPAAVPMRHQHKRDATSAPDPTGLAPSDSAGCPMEQGCSGAGTQDDRR